MIALVVLALPRPCAAGIYDRITVRGDHNYPPYEYLDSGVPAGFNVDIMRAVAKAMNLPIKIDLGPWGEVRGQLERGEIHALTGMFHSEERDKLVDFSTPHVIVSHALFVRTGSPFKTVDDLGDVEVVVQSGDIMHDFALATLPAATIFAVETQEEALRLLSSGEHDAALLSRLQNQFMADKLGLDNVVAVGPPIEPRRYCFAVREGDEALLAVLNEGMNLIKLSGEYDRIHDRWFGVHVRKSALRTVTRYALMAAAPVALLLLGSFLWSWALRRQVRQRTAALQESRERFQAVVEGSPLGMALTDLSGRILYLNQALTDMLGYTLEDIPDLPTWWIKAYPDPDYRKRVQAVWAKNLDKAKEGASIPPLRDWRVTCKDGTTRDIEFHTKGLPQGLLTIMTDVTESKRTAEVLVQTEKMMSVGGLAAGMAHEINNPLGGILQGVQNIIRRFSPELPANIEAAKRAGCSLESMQRYLRDRKLDSMLEGIRESGERAARIVANMLSFSRRSESRHSQHRIETLLDTAAQLASSDYDLKKNYDFRKIEIIKNYEEGLQEITCTETEIVQVLVNLLRNAAQALAMDDRKGRSPRITLSARREGDETVIEVHDNGPGMDAATRKRVFEPFYTTKPQGCGTGLGLSVSYFIITRNHGGTIRVESSPERGTAFIIRLPLEPPEREKPV